MGLSGVSGASSPPSVSANPLQLGSGGAKWYNNAGVIEAKDPTEATLAIVRGLTPVGTTDLTTKAYVDSLAGTSATSFQVNNDATGPKLKDSSGVLQVRNSADSAFVTVEVDTPTTSGHATTKGYVDSLSGSSATSFQIDNDNTGPKLKNNAGVLQVRNSADSAMVTVEVDTPTAAGHAVTKAYADALAGTSATSFQIDNDNTGPLLKNSAGLLEVRANGDAAYAIVRGLTAVGAADLVPLLQMQGITGTTSSAFQINDDATGPKLKDNAGVLQVRNSADSAFVTVEVDTPTASGHAATKGYVDAITGTSAGTWQLDNDNTGPKLKNNAGVLEVRNDADSAFLIVRGLTPVGTTDLTTKAYVDGKIATYTSALQSITAGGTDTLAHGLAGIPQVVQVIIKCNDAGGEAGYAQNDEIDITGSQQSASNRGIQVKIDATNITLTYGSDANSISVLNFSTGASAALTNTKWDAKVKAIYFS